MPTYDVARRFWRDHARLSSEEKQRFVVALEKFRDDLGAGRGFRAGLRVKRVEGTAGVWELTWADDGRATFEYGAEVRPGEPHVVWRRIGGQEILGAP